MGAAMDLKKVLERASIRSSGAVIIGSNIMVDGHEPNYPIRIITHIHRDHIKDINKSVREASLIIGTPPTLEILRELGYIIPEHKSLPLGYEKFIKLDDGEFKLVPSKHVIGSAQVFFRDYIIGIDIGYTSDFKDPGKGTPIMNVDVLIIESTYGKPEWSRPMKDVTEDLFIDLVKQLLAQGPVYIYGYHGKLQEAMHILRCGGVIAPFLAPYRVYRVSKITEKYGYEIGELYLETSEMANEILRTKWYVLFEHLSKIRQRVMSSSLKAHHIILTGWEFETACRRLNERIWRIALSDHGDFEDLMSYVSQSSPQLVIVDRARGGSAADVFANEITKNLRIRAIPMPISAPSIESFMR